MVRVMSEDPIDRSGLRPRFWERYTLDELTSSEWEALCDGCGKCCLLKLEDEDTGDVAYTSIACRLLDLKSRRCGQYALRRQLVQGCVIVRPDNLDEIASWMPRTCAYRLLFEGKGLEDWHPLNSGTPLSVEDAGIAPRFALTPEYDVEEDDFEDYVLNQQV